MPKGRTFLAPVLAVVSTSYGLEWKNIGASPEAKNTRTCNLVTGCGGRCLTRNLHHTLDLGAA
jgi:hypothetical protein